MTFDAEMLQKFREMRSPGGWDGASIKSWRDVPGYRPPDSISEDLRHKNLVRADITALRNDATFETYDLCVFILAWGEMHRSHASSFLEHRDHWMPVAEKLRAGHLDPDAGYQQFFALSRAKKMPGCGPAYYTKLLFFLPPEGAPRGIIMDQWTARSVNVLTQRPVVRLIPTQSGYRVDPANDEKVYSEFRRLVADLAQEVCGDRNPATVEEIEKCLFSGGAKGGGKRERWRELVAATDQDGLRLAAPDEELAEGYMIVFEPDPSSPMSDERHPSSRIFRTWKEAKAVADRREQRGKVLDIVTVRWNDSEANKPW